MKEVDVHRICEAKANVILAKVRECNEPMMSLWIPVRLQVKTLCLLLYGFKMMSFSGRYADAVSASKVSHVMQSERSYAGLLTVDPVHNSSLFFW